MRIVALEEHFNAPGIVARIAPGAITARGFPAPGIAWSQTAKRDELADLGAARIADMDASGITVQVLSVAGPGADLVPGQAGIDLARAYNDTLAEACARNPTRLRGFAHLPLLSPDAAALELDRAVKELGFHGFLVNGATDGLFLDDPRFEPVLATAEKRGVPIYCTPASRPSRCAPRTTMACPAISASPLRCPPGAGTRKPPSTRCAWCSAARSTAIPP